MQCTFVRIACARREYSSGNRTPHRSASLRLAGGFMNGTMPTRRSQGLLDGPRNWFNHSQSLSYLDKITTLFVVASFLIGATAPLRTAIAQRPWGGPALDMNANL